jgi:uncharacterized protein
LKDLVQKTEIMVRSIFSQLEGSHDWYHIVRVRNLAMLLSETEGGNTFIIEMASLLHDLEDRKLRVYNSTVPDSRSWLQELGVDPAVLDKILQVIEEVSYRGAGVETPCSSAESMIVQDADRLDAIGAIGIARAFAYGGSKNRPLFVPGDEPVLHSSEEDYLKHSGSTIQHFYEKLLLLKDRLNTGTARKLAEDRHHFMLGFLSQFHNEWNIENLDG